jgi:TolB-like protein/class 3 adenylate cyclase/predicted Zn-dependent protease
MSADEQRKLAAIMFTDMVGYSTLSQRDESLALELLAENQRLQREQFPLFNGREVKTTGDGFLVEFPNALQATQCAVEMQRAIAARNGAQPPERHIHVRIGIHVGDVVHREADMYGDGVNIAARIEPLAVGGGICLSDTVYAQVRNKLDVGLTKLDAPALKHIEVPIDVYRIVLPWEQGAKAEPAKTSVSGRSFPASRLVWVGAIVLAAVGVGWWLAHQFLRTKNTLTPRQSEAATNSASQKSIAVLPFENRSEDKANAYFADGIPDEILTRLAKIAGLKVIARTSTLHYRSAPGNIPQIASQLGVATVLEGSVQKAGDRVRINVQLINALTAGHLWAEIYDRELTDIFTVQSEVATAIAAALQTQLTGGERQAVTHSPTGNVAAYDAYLRGLYFANRPGVSSENRAKAVELLAEAVRLDPDFLPAWTRLSKAHSSLYFLQLDTSAARKEAARDAAENALRLNPSSPEAQLAQAYYRYWVERDYEGAGRLFENIREAIPSSSEVLQALALIARRQSRWKDSLGLFEATSQLNPRDPALLLEWSWTLSMLRRMEEAHKVIDRALNILPDEPELLASKAGLYHMQGDLQSAEPLLARLPNVSSADYLVSTRFIHLFLQRRSNDAAAFLQTVLSMPSERPSMMRGTYRVWLARALESAGDRQAALETYRQARDELEEFRQKQPDNSYLLIDIATAEAALGNRETALREGERALAMRSVEADPVVGPILEEGFARIEARCGEIERAVARLERLLTMPYGAYPATQALLRIDPVWDPLRGHPRFQKLVSGPEPKTIYQ